MLKIALFLHLFLMYINEMPIWIVMYLFINALQQSYLYKYESRVRHEADIVAKMGMLRSHKTHSP